jgi:hypothetical protein
MLGFLKFLRVASDRIFFDGLDAVWWAHQDSNLGPSDYESDALTN